MSIDVAIVVQLRVRLLQMCSNHWIGRILGILLVFLLVQTIVSAKSVVFLLGIHIWYVISSVLVVSPVRGRWNRSVNGL